MISSLSIPAWSQSVVGIKGGLNISNQRYRIEGERVSNESGPGISIHAGLLYERELSRNGSVMLELLYSAEGASESGDQGSLRLNYLQLPVMYAYRRNWFKVYAGPVFSYLLNVRSNSHGFGSDRRDAYENFTLSVAAGAEAELSGGLRLGTRYVYGLSNFLNQDFYSFDLRSHTDTFQVYVSFTFIPI
nr:porin family protein [Fulvivirga sedimenti]